MHLDRHLFGPFAATKYFGPLLEIEYLSGENGVASCNNSHIWPDSAALRIRRVWRILTATSARNEEGEFSADGDDFLSDDEDGLLSSPLADDDVPVLKPDIVWFLASPEAEEPAPPPTK